MSAGTQSAAASKEPTLAGTFSVSILVAALSLALSDSFASFLVVWVVSFVALSGVVIWASAANLKAASRERMPVRAAGTPPQLQFDIRQAVERVLEEYQREERKEQR